jgi:hypothetical protein
MYVYWVDTLEHVIFFGSVIALSKLAGPKLRDFLDSEVVNEENKSKESFGSNLKRIIFLGFIFFNELKTHFLYFLFKKLMINF